MSAIHHLARRTKRGEAMLVLAAALALVTSAGAQNVAHAADASIGHVDFNYPGEAKATVEVDLNRETFGNLFGIGDGALAGVAEALSQSSEAQQGSDAVRQAVRHFTPHAADYDLILAGDHQVTAMFGMWATVKGLIAMMIGGLGSIPGAMLGGLVLGVVEMHSQWHFGPQVRDLVAYLLLFACLVLRPGGLFGAAPAREAAAFRARV